MFQTRLFVLTFILASLFLAGCASDKSARKDASIPADQALAERIRRSSAPHTPGSPANITPSPPATIKAEDRSAVNRVNFQHFRDALQACGYSKSDITKIESAYLSNAAAWDEEAKALWVQGVKPLHILAEMATFEQVRHQMESSASNPSDPVEAGKTLIAKALKKDVILAQDLAALAAIRQGKNELAREWLDNTISSLSFSTAGDKSAKKSRSVFKEESTKTFRGEPFEQVMTYYYRGILYWKDGERDNARACFRNAQIQDSDTGTNGYRNDYVLLDYLDGLATAKLGGDGSDMFKLSQASAIMHKPPPYDTNANVILFYEFGKGPRKYATGQFAERLKFRSGPRGPTSANFFLNGKNLPLNPFDDLYYQAITRGGREMDFVLANKAVFKNSANTTANASFAIAMALASDENSAIVAPLFLLVAAISKGAAMAANPAADVRTWWNLPQYIGACTLTLPPGEYEGKVTFLDASGAEIKSLERKIPFSVKNPSEGDTVVLISDKLF